jgi:hypothetical protein
MTLADAERTNVIERVDALIEKMSMPLPWRTRLPGVTGRGLG